MWEKQAKKCRREEVRIKEVKREAILEEIYKTERLCVLLSDWNNYVQCVGRNNRK